MQNNFFGWAVARNNRNFLVANILFTILIIAFGLLNFRFFYNAYVGPFEMSTEDIDKIPELRYISNKDVIYADDFSLLVRRPVGNGNYSKDGKFFFTVKGESIEYFGTNNLNALLSSKREKARFRIPNDYDHDLIAEYKLLKIDEKVLIVKVPYSYRLTECSGVFVPLIPQIHSRFYEEDESLYDTKFYPFMLNVYNDFRIEAYIKSGIIIVLLAVNLVGYILYWVWRNYKRTFVYRKLWIHGEKSEVVDWINREVEEISKEGSLGKTVVTRSWIIKRGLFKFRVQRREKVDS